MAWLSGYNYRKSHVINSAVGAGTDYPIGIKVYYGAGVDGTESVEGVTFGKVYCDSKCKTDFGDIRFTDDDGDTELDYWMQEKTDSDYALFWVEVADNLGSNQSIYIYYGNVSATTTSNGVNTFTFFDDFSGANVDFTTRWTSADEPSYTTNGGKMECAKPAGANDLINTQNAYSNVAFHCLVAHSNTSGQLYVLPNPVSETYNNAEEFCFRWSDVPEKIRLRINSTSEDTNYAYTASYFKIIFKSLTVGNSTWEAYFGGALIASHTRAPANTTNYYGFLAWVLPTGYVDYAFIRKYVAPEPTHGAWGTEENLNTFIAFDGQSGGSSSSQGVKFNT